MSLSSPALGLLSDSGGVSQVQVQVPAGPASQLFSQHDRRAWRRRRRIRDVRKDLLRME